MAMLRGCAAAQMEKSGMSLAGSRGMGTWFPFPFAPEIQKKQALIDRERALEEVYFRKKEQEALEKLAKKKGTSKSSDSMAPSAESRPESTAQTH